MTPTIPSRSSDAGPEESKPRDWYEWTIQGREEADYALRTNRDSVKAERDERIRHLEAARDAMIEAIEDLRGPEAECRR